MSEKDNMKKYHGTSEIVARIAEESDNSTVREKWEELNTLVHLVHKDKVIKKAKESNNLSKTWDEIEHRMRLIKRATKGSGIDYDSYTEDKDFMTGWSPNVTYSFSNDDGSIYHPVEAKQMTLDFPEDTEKYIEENTLSTPLSEYEAIEKLSKDD